MTDTTDSPRPYPMAYEWGFDGRFTLSTDRVIGFALTINDAAEISRRWNAAGPEQEAAINGLVESVAKVVKRMGGNGMGEWVETMMLRSALAAARAAGLGTKE